MDFESPDVEKEFPGLYASESARKSNESDFSDEGSHDKHSKKELLGGKRKDKKDRKDRGYATLEGESSPDEDQETKSPSKSKKTKAFKFPTKKEKREKSREKETKEKDAEKEKDKKKKEKDEKDVDKEKRKDKDKDKFKQKLKDRKKGKHEGLDIGEEQPIFGVNLHLAVERSCCHDGVKLPLVIRDCIDYVEEHGMNVEGLYKVPGVKSKIQHLKKLYNNREPVNISEFEPTVATSLLILFLRELPESVLENSETISRFEQAASTKDVAQREAQLAQLTQQLPECNRILLAWVTLHLDNVTAREKTTKMNAQTISMTLSPVLQMSHRLLLALLFHCKALFPNIQLTKYIPPLSSGSTNLPDSVEGIAAELSKQESLLSQIHMQMNAGFVTKSREEQLWEVQRMITQLKRKCKTVQKLEGATQKSLDEEIKSDNVPTESISQKPKTADENSGQAISGDTQSSTNPTLIKKDNKLHSAEETKEKCSCSGNSTNATQNEQNVNVQEKDAVDSAVEVAVTPQEPENITPNDKANESEEDVIDKLRERLIYEELLNMQALLKSRISQEKNEIKRLMEMLTEHSTKEEKKKPKEKRTHSPNEAEMTAMIQLVKENQLLEKKMTTLIRSIIEEKDACVELRVQLAVHQLMAKT
ncbi:PREDICTED: ralA-binding protein 1 [Trachymyrmex cornetzi]|uniref:RalA-binding protein 1 n=1 Tax=Trachymyrmex cornetzi TaxID=471704 RepID=A0A151IZJ9_9HYME|nr:PREDICTED: ralA-binding protein 1 [Trachymyrmex cornetzi]KYN14536.1 RalA-binding protein 1 [Trachymyrmex cornetzi]